MTDLPLEQLLRLVRDGSATPEQFARAKQLAERDERLPEVIRQGVLEDAPAAEAAGLLALLEQDDGLLGDLAEAVRREAAAPEAVLDLDDDWAQLGEALRHAVPEEAGHIDIAAQVAQALDLPALPVADAVRAEAGDSIDVADAVVSRVEGAWLSAMLDNELTPAERAESARRLLDDHQARLQMTQLADLGRDLRVAVRDTAGEAPDLWDDVAHGIGIEHPNEVPGWDAVPFAEAVRAEAGDVDVVDPVMQTIRRHAIAAALEVPEPANEPLTPVAYERQRMGFGPILLVAAILLAALLYGTDATLNGGESVAIDTIEGSDELAFAAPDEIVIEDLSFSDDVTVFQAEGDEGALIIWIDEDDGEETL